MKPLYYIFLVCTITACKKDKVPNQIDNGGIEISCATPCDYIVGEYFGKYEILGSSNTIESDSVEVIFTDSSFSEPPFPLVQSWPYICQGTYTCSTDTVFIQNECVFPATIGSAEIFNGPYKFDVSEDSLYMERTIGSYPTNYMIYRYSLARQ